MGEKCKIAVFLKKNLLLYFKALTRQTKYDDQGRVYQNCKFHDPRCKGSWARA